jgi:hypothetical protein
MERRCFGLAVGRKSGTHFQGRRSKWGIYLTFLAEDIQKFEPLERFNEEEFECTTSRGNIGRRGLEMYSTTLIWDIGKSGCFFVHHEPGRGAVPLQELRGCRPIKSCVGDRPQRMRALLF